VADTGVHADAAGQLTVPAERGSIDGAVQHAACEVKAGNGRAARPAIDTALIQSRPEAPNVLPREVGELLVDNRSGAVCKPGAIPGTGKGRLEECLRCNGSPGLARSAASINGDGATHRRFNSSVRLFKALATESHHVGDHVDIDGLVFVGDSATDVSDFHQYLRRNLPLNGEVERIHDVWPEMRIKSFTGGRRDVVDARENRLRKRRCGGSQRGNVAVHIDTERSRFRRSSRATGAGCKSQAALNRLNQASAQQRHKDEVHAVQTTVNPAISAAKNGLTMTDDLAEDSRVKAGVPSCGDAGAE